DLGVRLERGQERRADERMREPRVAAAAGRVLVEAARSDRAADRGVALAVQRLRTLEPLVVGLRSEDACAARVARADVDVLSVRLDAELREPERRSSTKSTASR